MADSEKFVPVSYKEKADVLPELRLLAELEDTSVSDIIRQAVETYLQAKKRDPHTKNLASEMKARQEKAFAAFGA